MLRIEKLNFSYDGLKVLWDVNLEVATGEIVTVVGSNGAGKSTVLKNISRLLKPDSGSVSFAGEDLTQLQSHEVVERGIVQVPEGRKIFPELTVMENLRMGSYLKAAKKERRENMDWVFSLFPRLKERERQLGGTLSGGEQQMLAIGRGLMSNPRMLLLDEPSLGLAPLLVKNIFDIIIEINRNGVTILLVEQNVAASLHLCQRGYVLESGRITMTGTDAADMFDKAELLVRDNPFMEFRLDYLKSPAAAYPRMRKFVDMHPEAIAIATCRRVQNGGKFKGSLAAQLDVFLVVPGHLDH